MKTFDVVYEELVKTRNENIELEAENKRLQKIMLYNNLCPECRNPYIAFDGIEVCRCVIKEEERDV